MSIYYKQNFVSPEPLYAEVKEDLKSYFASGSIDDVLFPKWTEQCLKRFRKSAYRIEWAVIPMCDFQGCLPSDFNSVREAWFCGTTFTISRPDPSAIYYQQDCRLSTPDLDSCDECFTQTDCTTEFLVTHKVTGRKEYSFKREFLLKPGNIQTRDKCGEHCPNLGSSCEYTFDIHNDKIVTNLCDGTIFLLYYAEATEEGEQLVPDDFWVQEYIKKYITWKCFRQLCNIVTDETYNIVERKKEQADKEQAEAFILAETNLKKQTTEEKIRAIKTSYSRFRKYRL